MVDVDDGVDDDGDDNEKDEEEDDELTNQYLTKQVHFMMELHCDVVPHTQHLQ